MRQRICVRMPFPYQNKFAEIAAKVNGVNIWTDGIRFVRPVKLWRD